MTTTPLTYRQQLAVWEDAYCHRIIGPVYATRSEFTGFHSPMKTDDLWTENELLVGAEQAVLLLQRLQPTIPLTVAAE